MYAEPQSLKSGHSAKATASSPWRAIFAASIGNALEFYDLLIYGYFAVIIGKLFFPADDAMTSLLFSVGSFGISFVMRPLGAIVLGSYADRVGRKASLTLSILIMMGGTAMLTFVPSYASIGIAAPIIIIFARMLQGFSTGGEFGSSTAFMVEHADPERRGYFASWQLSTQGLATVLAAGVCALLSYLLSDVQLNSWGWRVAFGVGLLIGPVGLYIRSQIDETPDFKALDEQVETKTPLRNLLRFDALNLLLGVGVVSGATAFNYVHKVYMPTYAAQQLHIPATSSYMGSVITGLMLMLLAPVFGTMSDGLGRFKVLSTALILTALSSYPLFVLLNAFPSVMMLLAVQAMVGILIAACLGPIPAMLSDIFPTGTRSTGLALSYNIAVTVFGGFAPLIVTWMIAISDNKLAPSFYVTGTVLLSVVSVLWLSARMYRRSKQTTD